jgi:hypothetical protein
MKRAVSRAILLLALFGPAAALAGPHAGDSRGSPGGGRAPPQAQRPDQGRAGGSARPQGFAPPRPGAFGSPGQARVLNADAGGPGVAFGRGPGPAVQRGGAAPWGGLRSGAEGFAAAGRPAVAGGGAPYRGPAGYGGWIGHGWRRGEVLPAAFFAPAAVIGDWWDFGLFQPDEGLEWIRVGADAVLVDLSTGQVVDVAPGVYY